MIQRALLLMLALLPCAANAKMSHIRTFAGADPTGVADSSSALQSCVASLQATGGVCDASGGRYLINPGKATFTIPAGVTIDCGIRNPDPGANSIFPYNTTAALLLSPKTTLQLAGGSGLDGCVILRKDMTLPVSDSSKFSGTAISVVNFLGGGAHLRRTMVLGFDTCLSAANVDRLVIDGFYGDCQNGVVLSNSFDSARIRGLHLWPYATVGANGGNPPASSLTRTGVGLALTGRNDDTDIEDVFVFGYKDNIILDGAGNVGFGSIWSDNIGANRATNSKCFTIKGSYDNIFIGRLWVWSCNSGLSINADNPNSRFHISQIYASAETGDAIDINGGTTFIGQADISGVSGNYAINYINRSATLDIGQLNLHDLSDLLQPTPIGVASGSTSDKLRLRSVSYDASRGGGLYGGYQLGLPSLASGFAIVLPPSTTALFSVTGSASIGVIQGGWGGREITLSFVGGLTVSAAATGGNLALTGNADFRTSAGSILKLLYDPTGGKWIEMFRKP